MKKIIYYSTLIALWAMILVILGIILVFLNLCPMNYGFGYALGSACGHPQLWIVSIGIVLLLRTKVYQLILKANKSFNKSVGIILIVIGSIWLAMNVGARLFYENAKQNAIESYKSK